jgi:hypothetical protein
VEEEAAVAAEVEEEAAVAGAVEEEAKAVEEGEAAAEAAAEAAEEEEEGKAQVAEAGVYPTGREVAAEAGRARFAAEPAAARAVRTSRVTAFRVRGSAAPLAQRPSPVPVSQRACAERREARAQRRLRGKGSSVRRRVEPGSRWWLPLQGRRVRREPR